MSAKGMMLSERPSGGGGAGAGGGGGGAASSPVKIGNYKGVMLCNRPFAGTQAAAKGSVSTSSEGSKPAFLTGTQSEKIGANVSIMNKQKQHAVVNRSKKDTAPSKHKKWLRDLQKTKNELEAQMLREMEEKEKAKAKFMDREAKMRAAVRGSDAKLGDETMDTSEAKGTNQDEWGDEVAKLEEQKKKVLKERPMWSLTEGDAKEAVDAKEDDDADDLMNFAAELDFDKYIEDTEVNAMLEQVEQRVDELNAAEDAKLAAEALGEEKDDDENDDMTNAEAKESGGDTVVYAKLTAENLAKLGSDVDQKVVPDDLRSVAKSIMSEGKMSIHSERSLNMLAKKAKEKLQNANGELPTIVEPKIVTTQEDGGSRMEKKKDTSNLPYMHRNPAV